MRFGAVFIEASDRQVIDADRANAGFDKELRRLVGDVDEVFLELVRAPAFCGVLSFKQDAFARLDPCRFEFRDLDRFLVLYFDDAGFADRGIQRDFVDADAAANEMLWCVHVRSGVDAEVDMRENEFVTALEIVNAVDFVFGVAGPMNHAIADGNGEINPGRHPFFMVEDGCARAS